MSDETMCYAGRHPGVEGYFYVSIDEPEFAAANAKEIAKIVRRGDIVERVTLDQAKAGILKYKPLSKVKR